MSTPGGWLTVAEAAAESGLTRTSIRTFYRRGWIAGTKLSNIILIDPASLAEYRRTRQGKRGRHRKGVETHDWCEDHESGNHRFAMLRYATAHPKKMAELQAGGKAR